MTPSRGTEQTTRDACLVVGFGALLSIVTLQSLMGSRMPAVGWGYAPLVIQRCLEAAVFLLVALFASRLRGLASRRPLMVVCALALVVQCVVEGLYILGLSDNLQIPAHVLFCLVGSVCPSVLWMAWIELFARLSLRRMVVLFLGANVLHAAVSLVASLNSSLMAIACTLVVLPFVTLAALLKADALLGADAEGTEAEEAKETGGAAAGGHPATESTSAGNRDSKPRFLLAPVALMATFTLANVFARDVLPAADRSWATVGVLVCLIVLFVAIRRFNLGFDLWPLVAFAFPLTLAGLFGLLLDSATWGIPATLLTHAGDTLFGVFIAAALCNIAFRYGTSALYLFGLAKAAGSMALLAGALLAFKGSPWDRDPLVLLVAAMALAVCVCFVALSWRRDGEITWGVERGGAEAGKAAGIGTVAGMTGAGASRTSGASGGAVAWPGAPSASQLLTLACSQAAYEYGLTRREEEVLALLAQDMTAQQIEEALCVSNSTVKSHTHAVYQKMGLHSRAELIERMRMGAR